MSSLGPEVISILAEFELTLSTTELSPLKGFPMEQSAPRSSVMRALSRLSWAAIFSSLLRLLSMASKFLLIMFIAKILTERDSGTLNLMTQTIGNGVMLAGLQFFLYANRELSGVDESERGNVIRNQLVFYSRLYIVVLPLFLIVFAIHTLDWHLAGWFYAILISDHASYELQRMLASTHRAVKSNVIHTIRTGLWVYPLIAIMIVSPSAQNLTTIWASWLGASVLSVILAAWWLRGIGIREAFQKSVNWEWIKSGFKTTLQYLPVTGYLVVSTLIDRFVLENFHGREIVGVYGIFVTVANIVVTFPEAGICTVMGPKIINAYAQEKFDEHRQLLRDFSRKLIAMVAVLSVVAIIALVLALKFYVKKALYIDNVWAFGPILGSCAFVAIGVWPHFALYSRKLDKEIVYITILCTIAYLISIFITVPIFGIMGAAWSTFGLQAGLFFAKLIVARRVEQREMAQRI